MMSGVEIVQAAFRGWAGRAVTETVANLSLLTSFNTIAEGVIDLRHLILFGSLIVISRFINTAAVELKKGA
jgi:ABC-2 type transport system permease protein